MLYVLELHAGYAEDDRNVVANFQIDLPTTPSVAVINMLVEDIRKFACRPKPIKSCCVKATESSKSAKYCASCGAALVTSLKDNKDFSDALNLFESFWNSTTGHCNYNFVDSMIAKGWHLWSAVDGPNGEGCQYTLIVVYRFLDILAGDYGDLSDKQFKWLWETYKCRTTKVHED